MTEIFVGQSKTLREPGVSICTKAFFCFNGQNYLFNLSRTIELLKRNSGLSIVNEFPRNDTPASHTSISGRELASQTAISVNKLESLTQAHFFALCSLHEINAVQNISKLIFANIDSLSIH